MKIHYGTTTYPWRLMIRLPSVYSSGFEYATAQVGPISKVYGISFGHDRFIGFVIAGPVAIEESRKPTFKPGPDTCHGWDDPEERCPRDPKDCVCWQGRNAE